MERRSGQAAEAAVIRTPESGAEDAAAVSEAGALTGPVRASGPAARPGDAAREALRALRADVEGERTDVGDRGVEPHSEAGTSESGAQDGAALGAGPLTGPVRASGPSARPGDAAREALRALRADVEGERTDVGDRGVEPHSESGAQDAAAAGEAGPLTRPVRASGPSARPGDAAREALRAVREEAEGERTDVRERGVELRPGAGTSHPSAAHGRSRDRERRIPRAGTPDAPRLRDLRELLAGAFEAPASSASRDRGVSGEAERDDRRESGRAWARQPFARPAPDTRSCSSQDLPDQGPGSAESEPPPATARYPRSMAAPGRDGELRRTFAALPARPVAQRDRFAGTWWGNAWVAALEEGALDAARLARGRAYAGRGNVDAITVTPGLVLAYVQGSRPRPYRVQVRLRTFSDDEWERFLDAAAERPGHIAALLDKQVPQSLAECGVRLLPEAGDLEPRCSCPDFGHPCKHAAAVCYQTARLLDQDPFVLLLLRGRGERELLDALSRRNAARAARAAQDREAPPVPGVRARDAVAREALPPLPAPLQPPAHPEQPPVYPGAPGGPDPFALDQLATDAAARAHALLTRGYDPVAELTLWQDAVRLAAARPGSGLTAGTRTLYASLAAATGRTPADLARAVAAWRQGGRTALAVLEESWDPPAGRFDRARPLLLAADLPAFRPWRNRLTHPDGHVQLRLGQDGLWYAYESEPGHEDWWPRGTPDLDPVGALTGLGA
ncbi:SWIM zinc finger family protein [Streptomyces sp. NPDC005708]|uniref:SWIM zinc finger family protein n=1 Tax=Streptomyces sp. NPDC005708 TaxID=3154564 RepID=UPI0033F9E1E7